MVIVCLFETTLSITDQRGGCKDHFAGRADLYGAICPNYPDARFAYPTSLTLSYDLAWNCATGNG
jgi:hypothetical protein